MATNTVFGHVANVAVGATFSKYKDMNAATVRRSTMGGGWDFKSRSRFVGHFWRVQG